MTWTSRWWRRTADQTWASRPKARAVTRNGTPSPRQYAVARAAPRDALASFEASASTALRVGPMHGIQPRPKTAPSKGAPTSPAAGRQRGRHSRSLPGSQPTKTRPRTMVSDAEHPGDQRPGG